MLSLWQSSDEALATLTEADVGQLQRLFAEALQHSTAEASHLGGVDTANRFIAAEQMQSEQTNRDLLYLSTVAEGKRVDGLIILLKELNQYMLAQCGMLNELIALSEGHVAERLQVMQQVVLKNEAIVQGTIETVEAER